LSSLNALRKPQGWEKLGEKNYLEPREGTRREVLEALGKTCGMALEFPGEGTEKWVNKSWRTSTHVHGRSPRGVLEKMVSDSDYVFILEPGTIRVVSWEEALAFCDGFCPLVCCKTR